MIVSPDARNSNDPYDLTRFVRTQENDYAQALSEIRSGRKRTHWDHRLQLVRGEWLRIRISLGGSRDRSVFLGRGHRDLRALRRSRHSVSPHDVWRVAN